MTDRDDPKKPHLVAVDGDRTDAPSATEDHDIEEMGANDDAIRLKIRELEQEHRDLDLAIDSMEERMPYDRLTIQRLKKKKLQLKDEITRLHDIVLPDIIA